MSATDVLKFIKDKDAEFVDLRFTDPRGKLQHLTMDASIVDEEMINDGVFFDGSSIAGWKAQGFHFAEIAEVAQHQKANGSPDGIHRDTFFPFLE